MKFLLFVIFCISFPTNPKLDSIEKIAKTVATTQEREFTKVLGITIPSSQKPITNKHHHLPKLDSDNLVAHSLAANTGNLHVVTPISRQNSFKEGLPLDLKSLKRKRQRQSTPHPVNHNNQRKIQKKVAKVRQDFKKDIAHITPDDIALEIKLGRERLNLARAKTAVSRSKLKEYEFEKSLEEWLEGEVNKMGIDRISSLSWEELESLVHD
jgi:hypothetical protein